MSIYKGDKLVAGGSNGSNGPDWAHAVLLDSKNLFNNGYNATSYGLIVGWFNFSNRMAVLALRINDVIVSRAAVVSSTSSMTNEGNVQCPVNIGDHIDLACTEGNLSYSDVKASLYFVPYKAQ